MSDIELRVTARKILKILSEKSACIVHHWDMDGVASAATLASFLPEKPVFYVPPYTYSLRSDVIKEIQSYCRKRGVLVFLDYNLPGSTLDVVWSIIKKPIIVIDHHVQLDLPKRPFILLFNPAVQGDPRQLWPSAAHVVATLTGMYNPLIIALSIVGDLRDKARANRVFQKYMVEAGLNHLSDFELMADCVSQVSAADIMGRRDVLQHLSARLSDPREDPCLTLLQDGLLTALRVQAESELKELLSNANEYSTSIGIIKLYRFEGKGRHVSILARNLSSSNKNNIVMVVYYWIPFNRTYIYIRTEMEKPRLIDLAKYASSLGYSAGGKYQPGNNVVGIEIDGKPDEQLIEKIISKLIVLR